MQPVQPGRPVSIVEGVSSRHLGHVRGWVELIPVIKMPAKRLRQRQADGAFTAARNAGDDDYLWVTCHLQAGFGPPCDRHLSSTAAYSPLSR